MSAFDLVAIGLIALADVLRVPPRARDGRLLARRPPRRLLPRRPRRADLRRRRPLALAAARRAHGRDAVRRRSGRRSAPSSGRSLRQALAVLGPLRLFDNVAGGFLGAAIGLALCWALGAVLLYLPGQTELRTYARDSSILSTLNERAAADAADRRARAHRPVRRPRRPGAGRRRARPGRARLGRRQPRGAERRARRRRRLRARDRGLGLGRRRRVSSSRTRTSSPASTTPRIDRNDGRLLAATVVFFDKTNDIAVLRVPASDAQAASARGRASRAPRPGMLGYPGNGPYRETAVRVGARRHDHRPRRLRQLPDEPAR